MTKEEFSSIVRTLKSSFPYKDFLPDESAVTWFNFLNQYSYEVVRRGVLDYIEFSNKTPTINDILVSIRKAQDYTKKFRNTRKTYVKCKECNDLGYTLKTYPNGSEYAHICSCQAAKDRYPWFSMTEEEQNSWYEEESRRGRNPQKPFIAERDWVRDYLYPKPEKKEEKPVAKTSIKDFQRGQSDAFKSLIEE